MDWIRANVGHIPIARLPPTLSDISPKTDISIKTFQCTNYSRKEWKNGDRQVQQPDFACFTDGSAFRENDIMRTGCGVVIIHSQPEPEFAEGFNLGQYATVYGCEMEGIRQAAEKLLQLDILGKEIIIYSDNIYSCIQALRSRYSYSKLTTDTYQHLTMVGTIASSLTVEWIPGHRGYYGNETADELAKQGCSLHLESAEPLLPVRETTINAEIRSWVQSRWQERWELPTGCRQTKLWIPRVRIRNRAPALLQSRQSLRFLTGIITGHTGVRKHLHAMGVATSPLCDCSDDHNEVIQTAVHIIAECPIHLAARLLHFQQATIPADEVKLLRYKSLLSFSMAVGILAGEQQQSA